MTEKQSYVIRIEILMDIWIETIKVSFSTQKQKVFPKEVKEMLKTL